MNKILKTSLLVLAGIVFFGVNYATTPVAQATDILSFNAEPAYPIFSGTAVSFTWVAASESDWDIGTTTCAITGRGFPAGGISIGRIGRTAAITPTTTHTVADGPETVTYRMGCTTTVVGVPTGVSYKTVDVVIKPAGTAPVVNITATPNTAGPGVTQVTLHWGASNASSCTASSLPPGNWSGTRDPVHGPFTETVPLTNQQGKYKLTCVGGPSGTESGYGFARVDPTFVEPVFNGDTNISLLKCSVVPLEINGCFPIIVYLGIYKPASWLLGGAGLVFDTAIALSIDKDFITKPFVNDLWVIVRNFSNMIFIFILIYTGVQTMLNIGGWQRAVRNVVIIALLINFSLFTTKVVIDAGNILAVGIYSSMGADSPTQLISGNMKARGLSQALVAGFNPGAFLGATAKPMSDPFLALVVFTIATAVNVYAAYIFFKAALLFLGRLLAFWYLMIISPFAFTSITMPKGNIFNDWTQTLFSQAFVAPVFLFFIYIVMQVISSGVLSGMFNSSSTSFYGVATDLVIIPAILAMAIILALKKILKFTEGMAGDFGSAASNLVGSAVGTVGGLALGAATGGASMALRGTVGALASATMKSGALQSLATTQGGGLIGSAARFAGRRALTTTDNLQNATFDARNVSGVAKAAGNLGIGDMGKGSKVGYTKGKEEKLKKDLKFAEQLEITKRQEKEKLGGLEKASEEAKESAKNLIEPSNEADKAEKKSDTWIASQVAKQEQLEHQVASKDAAKKAELAAIKLEEIKKGTAGADGKIAGQEEAETDVRISAAVAKRAEESLNEAKAKALQAQLDHEATDEAKVAKKAREDLENANKQKKSTAEALKEAQGKIETENIRRRERFAQSTGRLRYVMSSQNRKERLETIKKAGSSSTKKEAKEQAKLIANLAAEMKKKEKAEGEATPEAPKAEKSEKKP